MSRGTERRRARARRAAKVFGAFGGGFSPQDFASEVAADAMAGGEVWVWWALGGDMWHETREGVTGHGMQKTKEGKGPGAVS